MSTQAIFQHQPGDTVSTAIRYSVRAQYQHAVDSIKAKYDWKYYCNSDGSACSFNKPANKELLLQWQPANKGYATDCQIYYTLLDKNTAGLWLKYNWKRTGRRYQGVEGPGKSLLGVNDERPGTRRVVLRDTRQNRVRKQTKIKTLDELDGYVINPPYPRFIPHSILKINDTLGLGSAGISGIVLVIWMLMRRRYWFR